MDKFFYNCDRRNQLLHKKEATTQEILELNQNFLGCKKE